MGRKSSIAKLDPAVREAVDRAVREGRLTNAEIVAMIDSHGAQVSESAVTRYVRSAREQMGRFRQAQEIAKVWVGKLEDDPQGDVGRLLTEMLRTVAFQTIGQMGDSEEAAGPADIMFLAKALKELVSADKIAVDKDLRVRKEFAKALEQKVDEQAAAGKPVTAEAFKALVREVYGG